VVEFSASIKSSLISCLFSSVIPVFQRKIGMIYS
jgi:hypothetical protein